MTFFFLLINIIFGYLFLRILDEKANCLIYWEKLLGSLISVITNIIIISTLLAIIYIYSLINISVIIIIENIIILIILKKYKLKIFKNYFKNIKIGKVSSLLFIIMLGTAMLYFLFPTTYMLAGRDPGLYLLNGIHIAETGSIQYASDEYLNEHFNELEGVIDLGYPGLYSSYELSIRGSNPGDIVPQFMPMFMGALAVGYDLFGMEGLIRVNGVIGILSLLVIFGFTKRFFNTKSAVLTVIILILNPAQLWTTRNTESEILAQLLCFLSIYIAMIGLEHSKKICMISAGLILGFSVMVRIDTYIFGVGIIIYFTYTLLWDKNKIQLMKAMVSSYIIAGGISFLYGILLSKPYFIAHLKNGSLSLIIAVNVVCLIFTGLIYILNKYIKINKNYLELLIYNNKSFKIVCFLTLLIIAVLYFIRPRIDSSFNGRALVEFCWYISVPILVFAIYGVYKWLYSEKKNEIIIKQKGVYLLFLFIGLASTCAYILRPSITPDHIWASRRWITLNIPFIIILGSYGVVSFSLYKNKDLINKLIRFIVIVYLMLFMLYQSKSFILTPIMKGVSKQCSDLAELLDDEVLYFTNNEEIASYMRYLYDKKVYMINCDNEEKFINYIKKNNVINFIGDTRNLRKLGFEVECIKTKDFETNGKFLEKTIGKYPRLMYDRKRGSSIYQVLFNNSKEIDLLDEVIILQGEYRNNAAIIANADSGIVFYGPYICLHKGKYSLGVTIDNVKYGSDVNMEIVSGEHIIKSFNLDKTGTYQLDFELNKYEENIEFRLINNTKNKIVCQKLNLIKQ